jgi:hypothetical protein
MPLLLVTTTIEAKPDGKKASMEGYCAGLCDVVMYLE